MATQNASMIADLSPIVQALLGGLFTWAMTAAGAAVVFVCRSQNVKFLDASLGFAAGVMTAASFWSLLSPAIEISELRYAKLAFAHVSIGFVGGALFVYLADVALARFGVGAGDLAAVVEPPAAPASTVYSVATAAVDVDAPPTTAKEKEAEAARWRQRAVGWRRIVLLVVAITVHNVPEGLAVGVGFGAVGSSDGATLRSAVALALGIGIQNFPEGMAVSLPLASFGYSRVRSFCYGQLSGMVEPIAALLGAWAVGVMKPVLPYALSFAAGAMIFVVVDDIIAEAQSHGNGHLASWGAIVGFVVMMSLDVSLAA